MKPEKKLWHEIKTFSTENNCKLSFTRVENSVSWGTPDLLGYAPSGNFFTLELKATKTNKVRLSPHQIAFHVKHPNNTFIMVKALSLKVINLYEGRFNKDLDARGLRLEACAAGLEACCLRLASL